MEIICALDFQTRAETIAFLDKVQGTLKYVKVGSELFTSAGPAFVEDLHKRGFEIFLDLKYCDIPNTVAQAVRSAVGLGVWMTDMHVLGGSEMIKAAVAAAQDEAAKRNVRKPLLVGITVLTSLREEDIHAVGLQGSVRDNVLRLAEVGASAGLDGFVCSVHEARELRSSLGTHGKSMTIVTPGIRLDTPGAVGHSDQKRVNTPSAALDAGSSFIVVGRAITQATDPAAAIAAIQKQTSVRGDQRGDR